MPPAEALTGFLMDAPSVLTLIQEVKGGNQKTSLMDGAFGAFVLTLQAIRLLNSSMSHLSAFVVLLSAIEVLAMIPLIADFQCKVLSWNLI